MGQTVPQNQVQEIIKSFNIADLLDLRLDTFASYAFIVIGIALCVAGYILYRWMIALTLSASGTTAFFLFIPAFEDEKAALWTSTAGVFLVLLIGGWVLHHIGIFLIGMVSGAGIGIWFWIVSSGRFSLVTESTTSGVFQSVDRLVLEQYELIPLAATVFFPSIAIGFLAVSWERRLVNLVSVFLGGTLIALGISHIYAGDAILRWLAVLPAFCMAVGLYLNRTAKIKKDS
jgi:hypothetical protein|tara:strand:- start:121 stop:813 length:693 start_codon:yes stop_codon:yes gene_type:complete